MASSQQLKTPITEMFGIKHPIILAGMNVAAGPRLAAAVTNAGGLGVIGGLGYTPKMLQFIIDEMKEDLEDQNAPFGIDLLLPQVGDGARATNHDYTNGELPDLIDVICKSGAKLFVSAVGVPPKFAVEKLHAAGIPIMNMIGAPKHAIKALEAGVDIICAQGGEGGGHTGDVATSILLPAVVDICKGKKSPLTGQPIHVVCAGGISDSRGLAMALSMGAAGVWVGTRFVASVEAGAPKDHKQLVLGAGWHDTHRTELYSGRPLRVVKNPYTRMWEEDFAKAKEMQELLKSGVVPFQRDRTKVEKEGESSVDEATRNEVARVGGGGDPGILSGQVAGNINSILPAKQIVDEMVSGAATILTTLTQTTVVATAGAGASKL